MNDEQNLIFPTKPATSKVKPHKRVVEMDLHALTLAREIVGEANVDPSPIEHWRMFVCNQNRGNTNFRQKYIVIPYFLWGKRAPDSFVKYYISHELAHAFVGESGHGSQFMEWLKTICPSHCLHYEASYKPNNAKKAGISNGI